MHRKRLPTRFLAAGLPAALILAAFILSGCGGGAVDAAQLVSDGEQIYTDNCARCHSLDGGGYSRLFPNLAGNPVVTLHDPSPILQTIQYGRGSMPGFYLDLTDREIAAVATYIRNAWGNEASPVLPKHVR